MTSLQSMSSFYALIVFTAIICVFVLCLIVLKRARSAKETNASFKISKILEISFQIKTNEDDREG